MEAKPQEIKPQLMRDTRVSDAESSSKIRVCYDVRFEGEHVLIYNSRGVIEETLTACLYRGTQEVVKKSGGLYSYIVNESEAIVINPVRLAHLTSIIDYGWFVIDSMLRAKGLEIFTAWRPIYLAPRAGEPELSLDAAITLPDRSHEQIFVVPSIKSTLYINKYNSHPIVPLLETITHMHQEFAGMSLCQVGIAMNKGFDPTFNEPTLLMRYLFELFRSEFMMLCAKENVALHKLHKSSFNLLFNHNLPRNTSTSIIRVVKNLKAVFIVPLCLFFNNMTCGDIPWIIAERAKKEEVEKRAKAIVYPLGFFENIGRISEMREAVFYQRVSILPEIVTEDRTYPAGGIIGIVERENKTLDTVFRCELFEDATLREQMILTMIYSSFLGGNLSPNDDCSQLLKNMSFNANQITVRPSFIKAIQVTLSRAS